jgi:hydrogenase maturation protease
MSRGCGDREPAPVLVLGLGNLLMRDDGVGLTVLEKLREVAPEGEDVEFVDGGTQGLALLGVVSGRSAILVLDAVALGADAGTVHRIDDPLGVAPPRADSAHEANAGELLRAAALLGDLPERMAVVGVEPGDTHIAIGLTDPVAGAVDDAVRVAAELLAEMRRFTAGEVEPCTS